MFTNIYQVKHFHQALISRIRFSSSAHLLLPRSDIARILKYNFIFLFRYKNAIFSIKICIDDTVRQCFPKRPVNGCIINPKTTLHPKWHFDIFRNLIIYTKIKVKYISRPLAGWWLKPVCPSDYRIWIFPVIQKIFWKISHNIILISKHKHTGRSGMNPFIIFRKNRCPDYPEIFLIIQPLKRMSWLKGFMAIAITADGLLIQIFNFSLLKHFHIHGFICLIPQHRFDLQSGTVVISLPISAKCPSKQIIINVYRLLLPLCAWHPDYHNHVICTSYWESFHIIVFQKIDAHLFTVVNRIPEIFLQFCRIFQPGCMPIAWFILFYPKNNNAAIAIGKSRIRIPQTIRKSAFCPLYFPAVIFFVGIKFCQFKQLLHNYSFKNYLEI